MSTNPMDMNAALENTANALEQTADALEQAADALDRYLLATRAEKMYPGKAIQSADNKE